MANSKIFNKVAIRTPRRNSFDLSHGRKFSANIGFLTPCLCEEFYPNEDWYISGSTLTRTAPMVAPMMHQVDLTQHYYGVPYRILWSNWDLFITGGDKFNSQAPVPVVPYVVIPAEGFQTGSIADFLGFPTKTGGGTKVSAFPFAAYLRIVQEFYRDENLQDVEIFMLRDGDNTDHFANFGHDIFGKPFASCWEKDYFTSALPEPQKGPEVTIPLGDTAPIVFDPDGETQLKTSDGDLSTLGGLKTIGGTMVADPDGNEYSVNVDNSSNLFVDLAAATSATINSWRLAMAVQRLYEKLARGGSRTVEYLKAVWGADASSARLDRPEYFGGSKETLSVSEVLQTSETNESPQGNMSGHGVAVSHINGSHYKSYEHGVIIGIFRALPRTAYQQGVRKAWLRLQDRFDFYLPDLAHIGEQPVLNAELYLTSEDEVNQGTFGYLPYGTELRYIPDTVHGEFRDTQDFWHMGRIFEEQPQLNSDFVTAGENVTRRVFADISGETSTLYVNLYTRITAKRPVPMFGTPM